jgi:hypothetical protein
MHDPVALFQAAAQRSSAVMAAVRVEQLSAPTPCGEWSVQQLMDHMAGGPAYLPERDRAGGLVGPAVQVPAAAPAQDRLLAAMGRRP